MIIINFVFIIFFIVCHALINTKIIVEQYYSIKRFYKLKFQLYKTNSVVFFKYIPVVLLGIVLFYLNYSILSVLVINLLYGLILPKIPLHKYPRTRRSITFLMIYIAVCFSISFFVYFYISEFLLVMMLPVILSVGIFLTSLIQFPIESMIRYYYIKKAHDKIVRNNYFVIAVTGSFGKTTLKNIIYSILKTKYKISFQNHNYNTIMGLCKYINNEVANDDEILIVELGVDHPHSMIKFKKIFNVDIALISSIGEMHLATFKSLDKIYIEKFSIEKLLKKDGKLLINSKISKEKRCLLNTNYSSFCRNNLIYRYDNQFELLFDKEYVSVSINNEFQIDYLDAALKIAKILKLNNKQIKKGLQLIEIPDHRGNIIHYHNSIILDDCYNANYAQMMSVIKKYKNSKLNKIAITGGLIEVGDKFEEYNYKIGRALKSFDQVILISNDENHPLKNGYEEDGKNIIIADSVKKGLDIALNYEKPSFIFLSAKGSNYFLK